MNDSGYTAVVFGASGLTGRFVTEHLIHDNRYSKILLFVREEIPVSSKKINQVIFNPEKVDSISSELIGDHLFCCLGTTIKKAGSKKVFYSIDHDLVVKIATIAAANNFRSFVVISSIGANYKSKNFYLNTKGKMEESLKSFKFENLSVVRPSILLGLRHERRMTEEVGKVLMKVIAPLLIGKLSKYRPIHSSTVAKSMIKLANLPSGVHIFESDQLEKLITS
ncbi:MAG: NAD(P)H-binding protein [Omnitrophica WOR_2 bacterium]